MVTERTKYTGISNIRYSTPNYDVDNDLLTDIEDVLSSGWVSIGKYVDNLEFVFQELYNVKHAIACANATNGLIIALKAAGWKNKRIALPAFTWPSTLYALECSQGNEPVFCDIDLDTWHMQLPSNHNYDAVLAVDTFGNQLVVETDKPIIYDAAHGFRLPLLGKRGLVEVVSLSHTKVVTAMEGGIILTNDDNIAEIARELVRLSARMEEINALVALNSMNCFDYQYKLDIIETYREYFEFEYTEQKILKTNASVYAILFETSHIRNVVKEFLKENGIETKVYYDPLKSGLPNTDFVYSRILALPLAISERIARRIAEMINEAVKNSPAPGKKYLSESYVDKYFHHEN